jgi:sporulation protein YlmC with PRC-barrel domain
MRDEVTSADTLVGSRVVDREGELLGVLEELLMDLEHGRVACALVARRSDLEEEELVGVPWAALRVERDHDRLVLTVRRETFEQAPRLDPERRPEAEAAPWQEALQRHYEQDPNWGKRIPYGHRVWES